MKNFILITGNQHKADYFAKWFGAAVEHRKISVVEIQSLDLREIVSFKAHQAYKVAKKPVLVEDVALTFTAMGRLPGSLIKWFLEELGTDGLCRIADGLEHRKAEVSVVYALFDGKDIRFFASSVMGKVAEKPRGKNGFGWNAVFIPEGSERTYAEMDDEEIRPFSMRAQAIDKLREFLQIP